MARKEYIFKGEGSGGIAADVFYPEGDSATTFPIALYFHGGNFTVGSKELLSQNHIEKLLGLGFVVVSANYRLCPTISVFEGPATDAFDAYGWAQSILPGLLHKDAGVRVDGAKIVVLGHSAGGLLALLTAGSPRPPRAILDFFGMKYLQDASFHTPSAAFAKLPPFDKAFLDQRPDFSNPRVAWMFNLVREGKLFSTVVADGNYDRVDPATLFARLGKDFPPTYFIHGTADTLVDWKLSQRAHDELRANGVDSKITLVDGAPHGFDAKAQPGDETFAIVEKGFEFFKAHL
ncbi:hypothetical protein SLS63_008141 [Diaporthe eres]|uniref:Alpha/beta hydrolase fold-3 domain-containing protein n=1 Tax=Diaporthe eres TaxID=83184 RepID=A0ABR1P3J5_DIAER